jgi:hypothetical protein
MYFVTAWDDGEESYKENDDRPIDVKGLKTLHCAVQYDFYFGTNCAEKHLTQILLSWNVINPLSRENLHKQ